MNDSILKMTHIIIDDVEKLCYDITKINKEIFYDCRNKRCIAQDFGEYGGRY